MCREIESACKGSWRECVCVCVRLERGRVYRESEREMESVCVDRDRGCVER